MDFNVQSINWDNENRIKRAKIISEEIASVIDIKEYYSALEFGCGTGLISFNLYDKIKDITCIDTSQGMIEMLNTKIQQNNVKNITAYQHDINNHPSLSDKYDLIYTSMALHHIVDIETTLTRLYKLLKKNGYLCIVDLNEDDGSFHKLEVDFNGHNGFNQNELKKVLGKIGYKELASHTFYNDTKHVDGVEISYSLFVMTGRKI
ncbi:class I SAM-dependent methyltransferase [Dendrosporobacter sp. 1207_IL3150]|uniref:class I SAM-dependent methyltransferase n=1 Tax=Dendrosporobacter sp. 1207_IL3150 TaxID=3084054 RepID=UPI002FDB6639